MNINSCPRYMPLLSVIVANWLAISACADAPSFVTTDPRLPNPHRPYDMRDGRVEFLDAHDLGLYDLQFQALDPEQVDAFELNEDGNYEFDSLYDVAYEAQVSFGLGPVHRVIGQGKAHIRGVAPGDVFPIVFNTEVVTLDLVGLSPQPDFLFRESPTLRSGGTTIVGDGCPQCDPIFPIYRISSFLDIFAEASADGGKTWAPADKVIHVVQQAEPPLLGDYNDNGTVDAADYVVWRENLGPGSLPNEAVSNGVVDEADHNFWRSRFGDSPGFRFIGFAAAAPEPSTCLMLALAAFVALLRCRGPRSLQFSQPSCAIA